MSLERLSEEYLRHLTIERGLSKNTLQAYRRDLKKYMDFLARAGVDSIQGISEVLVSDFAQSLGQDHLLKPSSAARIISAVRGLHKFWLYEGLTEADASGSVTPPKVRQNLPHPITLSEMVALLDGAGPEDEDEAVLQTDPIRYRDRALVELLFSTGGRISEVLGLDVDDLIGDYIRLTGKGAKQRNAYVGKPARKSLEAYLVRVRPMLAKKGRGTPALFLNQQGGRLSRQSAWQIIKIAAERGGIDPAKVSPHTIRHTFATLMLQRSGKIKDLQEFLGHSSVTTTQIYTKVTADTVRDAFVGGHPRARR